MLPALLIAGGAVWAVLALLTWSLCRAAALGDHQAAGQRHDEPPGSHDHDLAA